jgi:chromodomain-helicase-DNA-binding protein 4
MGCHESIPQDNVSGFAQGTGQELLFRCVTCTRASHYAHLRPPSDEETFDTIALALHYQHNSAWKCADCVSFVYKVDKILAWRPSHGSSAEPLYGAGQIPDYTHPLPREYLVKWQDRAYKRASWVPHMWLLATNKQRLRKFVAEGRTVKLLDQPRSDESASGDDTGGMMDVDISLPAADDDMFSVTKRAALLAPLPDADRRIPLGWLTVDRVLSVLFLRDPGQAKRAKAAAKRGQSKRRVTSDDDETGLEELSPEVVADQEDAYNHGEQPRHEFTEDIEEFEKRTKRKLSVDQTENAIWCLFKWQELGYEEGMHMYRCSLDCPNLFSLQQHGMPHHVGANQDSLPMSALLRVSSPVVRSQSLLGLFRRSALATDLGSTDTCSRTTNSLN